MYTYMYTHIYTQLYVYISGLPPFLSRCNFNVEKNDAATGQPLECEKSARVWALLHATCDATKQWKSIQKRKRRNQQEPKLAHNSRKPARTGIMLRTGRNRQPAGTGRNRNLDRTNRERTGRNWMCDVVKGTGTNWQHKPV